jgi:hypothetical protein
VTRSFTGFGLGLLVLVSPLRRLWAQADAGPWGLFLVASGLLVVAFWVSRSEE